MVEEVDFTLRTFRKVESLTILGALGEHAVAQGRIKEFHFADIDPPIVATRADADDLGVASY